MSDTVQRISDLLEVADNKEARLLATIVRDHIKKEQKTEMGFRTDVDELKEKVKKVKGQK